MAFRYLMVSGLHLVVDDAEERVVDIYLNEAKAYEVMRGLNRDTNQLFDDDLRARTSALSSQDLKTRHSDAPVEPKKK